MSKSKKFGLVHISAQIQAFSNTMYHVKNFPAWISSEHTLIIHVKISYCKSFVTFYHHHNYAYTTENYMKRIPNTTNVKTMVGSQKIQKINKTNDTNKKMLKLKLTKVLIKIKTFIGNGVKNLFTEISNIRCTERIQIIK